MAQPACIRIGNQTAFSASPPTAPFDYAVARGFDAFEWFPDKQETGGWSEQDLTPGARDAIKRTAIADSIRLSVHVPWQADPLHPDFVDVFARERRFADDIGARLLNIHLVVDRGIAAYLLALLPVLKETCAAGLTVAIENTPFTGPDDFNVLFRQLREEGLGPPSSVGMCLDLGHANLFAETRNDYVRFVDLLDPQVPIVHVHAHENHGDADSHLPLFTGPSGRDPSGLLGIIERLKERGFTGSIILEQWPEPRDLLDRARGRLLEMIGAEYQSGGPVSPPPSRSTSPGAGRHRSSGILGEAPARDAGPASAGKPTDEVVAAIGAADRARRTWREKLGWIHAFLADAETLSVTDRLAYAAIYLRLLGTGEIAGSEAGGHHRPSHHARLAAAIHEQLARMATPDNQFIIRRILPWLPSFGRAFTRAEPLTRIRDIAHRNDIPGELKREIKTTLQNKLHSNAGPEDLVTSAALLERITAPGAGYPRAFVEEFRRFHRELEEFFNARSLEARLEALRNGAADDRAIGAFLEARARATTPDAFLEMLELLTNLRRSVLDRLRESSGADAQDLEMADLSLEQFSFPILGRLVDSVEIAPNDEHMWSRAFRCLVLSVENLGLGDFDREECDAIRSELNAWTRAFDPSGRLPLLRLEATLERCRRLADSYTDRIVRLFSGRAAQLGRALGVSDEAVRAFGEAEVRSHPVFQLSRLVDHLLATARSRAALQSWDAVVPGTAIGLLEAVSRLTDIVLPPEPRIVLVDRLEGDEEIPSGIAGMVVGHELPHLSHLSIRARERQIPFASCLDRKALTELAPLAGARVVLRVSAKGTLVERAQETAAAPARRPARAGRTRGLLRVPDADLSSSRAWLPLDQATLANAGGKAAGARRLEELSRRPGAPFATPRSLVIPFSVMNRALSTDAATEAEYRELAGALDGLGGTALASALARLRELTLGLNVPAEVVSGVLGCFGRDQPLIVRSSAGVEDLDRWSAAGLYESVANVRPDGVGDAVRRVWASLWTDRAVISGARAGIDHSGLCMGVLIQEMPAADLSFVLHTVNPIDHDEEEVYAELAVGLGETLTSGSEAGTPYRLAFNTRTGAVRVLAFASFSRALRREETGGLRRAVIDYSKIALSALDDALPRVASRLGALGGFLETSMGSPQDVEGLVQAGTIYVVQSRHQHLALDSGLRAPGLPRPR